ncbi:MAG: hypothetical protein U0791_07470 [Gemmataceae bacterium]
MPLLRLIALCLTVLLGGAATGQDAPKRVRNNLERLAPERLKATHEDVQTLAKQRVAVPKRADLTDYRCILHAHAGDSTHTGGTVAEMTADAKKAGVHAILLSDHFRPPADFIDGRPRGMRDGVLFIPGSEVRGFLVHPMKSIFNRMELKGNDFIDTVTDNDGLIFLSHLEERRGHAPDGLTGYEIYNRHWDAKQDTLSLLALGFILTDPKQLATLERSVKDFPDEVFAFQCDYPKLYLEKWDADSKKKRLTGVAANDCHHNQILTVKMVDAETVLVGTNVDADDKMQRISAKLRPGIREMTKGHNPGDILARVDVDPYFRSFRNSATHVLAAKLDEASIRAALKAGRAYVSHDWMGDATGFRFECGNGVMGDEAKFAAGMTLTVRTPLPCLIRVLRHGKEVARSEGKSELRFEPKEPGAYRVECWLTLDGEPRPWIFSNPIDLKP